MSVYQPKRKTNSGTESVTFPISSVDGLSEKIDGKTLAMPRIRVGAASDYDGTMCITETNPLIFAVQIIDGKLEIGDEVQICTRQLFTYDEGRRRKYRLRCLWNTLITEENVNNPYIFVSIFNIGDKRSKRLFCTGAVNHANSLSPLYVRVRRPILQDGHDVDGTFSNIETVWKKYDREINKIFVK